MDATTLRLGESPGRSPASLRLTSSFFDWGPAAPGPSRRACARRGVPRLSVTSLPAKTGGHVVWSRIDTANEKAVPLAFDREKLMMVTREFARDHGLSLPKGYGNDGPGKDRQLSLYEQHQQASTGLTKEQRMEQVTDAWRASDSAQAFVQALAEQGYILATGKRPFVLIDLYGGMNALPKLIDDRNVRTKDIREFLGAEYAPENLPGVEEARALAAKHRKALEDHKTHEQKADAIAGLKKVQAQRRQKVEQQQADLRARQHKERQHLERRQRHMRDVMRGAYIPAVRELKQKRRENRPTGLAAFLGRISGVEAARRALHRYQDRKRIRGLIAEREKLRQQQERDRTELNRRQQMQAAELARQERALNQIDRKELHSLEVSLRAEQRTAARGGSGKMPSLNRDSKSRGRPAAPGKAKSRYRSRFAEELAKSAGKGAPEEKKVDLAADFERAAADGKDGKFGRGSSEGPKPLKRSRSNRRRRRDQDKDRGR